MTVAAVAQPLRNSIIGLGSTYNKETAWLSLIGRTFAPANDAIKRLESAGILRPVSVGRRNRAFEATGGIETFTALERQLASPQGDTLTSEPSRPVPYRQAAADN